MLGAMKRLALVALFLVAACGSLGVQSHTISLAYKAGDTYKYTLHAVLKYTIGAAGMSIPFNLDMSAKETVKVKSVDSSGTADLSIDLTDLSVKTTTNGVTNTTTTTTSTTVEVKVAKDGRVVSVNGSALGGGTLPGLSGSEGGIVSAILPDNAVKPGDTWTKNYDQANVAGSTGSIHVTTDNKYLRDEQVNSVNAAVVESKINATLDLKLDLSALGQGGGSLLPSAGAAGGLQGLAIKGATTTDVTSWIDASAHRIVKSHSSGTLDATMTMNMTSGSTTPGLTGPFTFKGTQTLDMNPA
jgi:hypothetical protein